MGSDKEGRLTLYNDLVEKKTSLSVIGLGYVGLPVAAAFAKKVKVVGFDTNAGKISLCRSGKDPTGEVGDAAVAECAAEFTNDPARLREASFHIVSVPTPVRADKTPDLSYVESASAILGKNLARGSVVVYESTVYPGVTEDVCAPILERESGLKRGVDFKIGYSPERINPGDSRRRLHSITKVVSGMDAEALATIASVYELVVEAGVYRARSIKVAEAAKVIENAQRDLNIAFVNELAMIFDRMGVDTLEVLEAAGTKWNFLDFKPGLVGGHCIGVDPYYLTYCAERLGYHSQVILAGRRINDGMGKYIAEQTVKQLIKAGNPVQGAKAAIMGFTFKENCPDTRNTKVYDVYAELVQYGIKPLVFDPVADAGEVMREYGIALADASRLKELNALILAVKHDRFASCDMPAMLAKNGVVIDVKGFFAEPPQDTAYWRL